MRTDVLLACGLLPLIAGCVTNNPYSQFYNDATQGKRAADIQNDYSPPPDPVVYQGKNTEQDAKAMLENGFMLLGWSSFSGAPIDQEQAVRQARSLRASAVIVYSTYTHTLSGAVPLLVPDVQTVTTHNSGFATGSGTAFGSGGMLNYSGSANSFGSSQTTINGSRTMYMPYNVNQYDYHASFWIKNTNIVFGALLRDLTLEERRSLGSNHGAAIRVVVKNSPAFDADLIEGDIIKKLNDTDIAGTAQWYQMLGDYLGKTVVVTIFRNGKEERKTVTLRSKVQ